MFVHKDFAGNVLHVGDIVRTDHGHLAKVIKLQGDKEYNATVTVWHLNANDSINRSWVCKRTQVTKV